MSTENPKGLAAHPEIKKSFDKLYESARAEVRAYAARGDREGLKSFVAQMQAVLAVLTLARDESCMLLAMRPPEMPLAEAELLIAQSIQEAFAALIPELPLAAGLLRDLVVSMGLYIALKEEQLVAEGGAGDASTLAALVLARVAKKGGAA